MLKIGDFGMATAYPAVKGIEREGDREYIAPEVLSSQQYDKPADVFSLGIMMLEIAANIVLPDNGIHWQKLRSGDLTDAGRLSSGDLRRANEYGDDEDDECDDDNCDDDSEHVRLSLDNDSRTSLEDETTSPRMPPSQFSDIHMSSHNSGASNRKVPRRLSAIPPWAPKFMVDKSGALDVMVKWLLNPDPHSRPTTHEILISEECQWVEAHRRAGAVIYEGDYGPEPDPVGSAEDHARQMLRPDHTQDNWRRGV
ncbi:tyrosine protein kinase SWE1 [Sugiyamaella lignohabitans]|uniref:Tyrosine protein kinase SWE1 n=1 Tax=Sugiyamaella lignohabitans TaxID=796027 RepID=A0A167E757_9ASCO|nr:tyrosine protein kinase SWE1 [Sugiyamaella lignohabitans]ANB13724.1 tyrosine protein kinase SWE1 [Sugiyamaella lignohabitans]